MEYFAEVIDPQTAQPTPAGELGELVVTNFGRGGSPLIRYRNRGPGACRSAAVPVRPDAAAAGRWHPGPHDDMIHLRGNNVYPSALEGLIADSVRWPNIGYR